MLLICKKYYLKLAASLNIQNGETQIGILTARRHASAVSAMTLCLSILPTVTSLCSIKRTAKNVIKQTATHNGAVTLVFWLQNILNFNEGTRSYGAKYTWVGRMCDFRQITCYISKTLQRRRIISMKKWTGSCMRSVEWWYCWWPWVTLTTTSHASCYVLALSSYLTNGQS